MFLDAIEAFIHGLYGRVVHILSAIRHRALEDKAVVVAEFAQTRRRLLDLLDRAEAAAIAEFHDLEAKAAKAEEARARVEDFLNRL